MDKERMVAAWEYYHRSEEETSITTGWEATKTFNGIKIFTKFMNSENGFAISFTGIEIK
ncbi:MAG: hypothetical protein ACJAT1_000831 [Marivirga sp.]|jgi:hypothetical protein